MSRGVEIAILDTLGSEVTRLHLFQGNCAILTAVDGYRATMVNEEVSLESGRERCVATSGLKAQLTTGPA
jgi:hypothetical protein